MSVIPPSTAILWSDKTIPDKGEPVVILTEIVHQLHRYVLAVSSDGKVSCSPVESYADAIEYVFTEWEDSGIVPWLYSTTDYMSDRFRHRSLNLEMESSGTGVSSWIPIMIADAKRLIDRCLSKSLTLGCQPWRICIRMHDPLLQYQN